ncbi:MAG: CBS domain-containing protein [Longispora sp.]|nr:CBS domain-containing protein [Longispora sp. (in: high G+C Gram-positive bacteria)]
MAKKISDVMSAEPVTVGPHVMLSTAARCMRDNGIGDVLVTDGQQLFGILTDRDIVVRAVAENRHPDRVSVAEVCSDEPVSIGPDDDIDLAIHLMREHAIRRLPVTREGQVVGVVSLGDLALERDEHSVLAYISATGPNI